MALADADVGLAKTACRQTRGLGKTRPQVDPRVHFCIRTCTRWVSGARGFGNSYNKNAQIPQI